MGLHADIAALLAGNTGIDISFLFRITVPLGSTTTYFRYCIDNIPRLTDSGAATWTPWPIEVSDFITRLSSSQSPTRITFFDPDDSSIPGSLKSLIQNERILNRARFELWLVFGDPSANVTQDALSFTGSPKSVLTFPAPPPHGLGVGDFVSVDDGTGVFHKFQVTSVVGDVVTIDNNTSLSFADPTPTVRKPFFKDSSTWYKLFSGMLRGAEMGESTTVLNIQPESDLLAFPIPRVNYSFPCPYVTGDVNCLRKSTAIVYEATFTVQSVSGTTLSVINPTGIKPTGATLPIPGATDEQTLWKLGIAVFQTGDLVGTIRNIVGCAKMTGIAGYVLTLDKPVRGSYTSGTVMLRANCNRSYEDCKARFANQSNFGGVQSIVRAAGGINAPRQLSSR